jgi:hypothetical protein
MNKEICIQFDFSKSFADTQNHREKLCFCFFLSQSSSRNSSKLHGEKRRETHHDRSSQTQTKVDKIKNL